MKGITHRMLLGCLTVIALLVSLNYANAQASKQEKRTNAYIKSILKMQEICHDRLPFCCRDASQYCGQPDCQAELMKCHGLEYDDFLAMANSPYGGVTKDSLWIAQQINALRLDCETDYLRIDVNEENNSVTFSQGKKARITSATARYSVAFIMAIMSRRVESITFYEGRYLDDNSATIPFKVHAPETLSTEDKYFNLSDTEGR